MVGLTALGMLSACADTSKDVKTPLAAAAPPPAPAPAAAPAAPVVEITPGLSPKARIKRAIGLLAVGDAAHARAELQAAQAANGGDELAQNLLMQIDGDPKSLLGASSFSYVIRPGESLSILAERYLKDRFKFYLLARYNGIADPSDAKVGETIQIPGARRLTPPREERARDDRHAEDRKEARREAQKEAAKPQPVKEAAAQTPSAQPPREPARDPGRASELRARALEEMSKGVIEASVSLLRKALVYDPHNPLIEADLERANRLEASVR
jgi:hypothetical protein